MATKKSMRVRYMLITCVVVIFVMLIIIIWMASSRNKETVKEIPVPITASLTGYIRPKAVTTADGIHVKWFPNAQLVKDIDKAAGGSYNMVELSLTTTYNGDEGITLDNMWQALQPTNLGVKIDAKSNEEAEAIIGSLKSRTLDHLVLVSVPLLSPRQQFDWQRFTEAMSTIDSNGQVGINIKISPSCCGTLGLEFGTVEYIGFLIKKANFSTTIEMDAALIPTSWTSMKWLLDTNPNLQLILSAKSVNTVNSTDLLLVRNDIDSDKVLYNIDGALYAEFLDLASTAGSPLLYFGITPRDASDVIWSHNTDTWQLLDAATQGDVMMIEGDIMLLGQDTPNQTNIPIMAHDVGEYNNLTFEQWLGEIIKVDKGMKLDFKKLDAVRPTLEIVKKKKSLIKGPIWANADVLRGPKSLNPGIPIAGFLDAVETFPNVVLSLGWTTVHKGGPYNMSVVQEMYNTVKNLPQPVTFPVRAEQLVDSWSAFEWLLGRSRGYTLTVWTAKGDDVTKSEMDTIRKKTEASRIYFDLPPELRPTIT